MFRAAYRSSSGALTVFAASGLHVHVVTGRSQVWVGTQFPLRLDYGQLPHARVNQRLQIQLELLMMSGMPLETCWACNERWNNKFYYKVTSCWLFLLSHTTMHGSMNIKKNTLYSCPILMIFEFPRVSFFEKFLKYYISWKSVEWEPSWYLRTDGRTDMTELIVAFLFLQFREFV